MTRPGGYAYHVDAAQIRAFQKLPALQKLRLLEEMLRFLDLATPPGARRIREQFRRGEI